MSIEVGNTPTPVTNLGCTYTNIELGPEDLVSH